MCRRGRRHHSGANALVGPSGPERYTPPQAEPIGRTGSHNTSDGDVGTTTGPTPVSLPRNLSTMRSVRRDNTMNAPACGPTFRFRCLRCGSVLEARIAQVGERARCPSCDAVFVVPQVDPRTGLALGGADPGHDGQYPAPVHAYAAAGHAAPRIVRLPDDSLVIECPNCLHRTDIKANNCPACGRPFFPGGQRCLA